MGLKPFVYFVGCFLWTAVAWGQNDVHYSLRGVVLNERMAPLANATVELRSAADSGIYKTTISDKSGEYSISGISGGSYFLKISMVGYDRMVGPSFALAGISAEKRMDTLSLRPTGKELGSVTVRAQPNPVERKLDRTVYNVENSVTSEGSTALEVMQRLPGVQVSGDGSISLAGKQNVNVFIDGKPSNLGDEDLANLLRGMPSGNIQRIEIMSNPSAKYDAAGSGGIINIVRKRTKKEGWNGSVTGGAGQGEYPRYNGAVNLSYKDAGYSLYANMAYLHNKALLGTNIESDVLNPDKSLDNRQLTNTRNVRFTNAYTPAAGIDFNLSNRTTLGFSGVGSIQDQGNTTTSSLQQLDGNLHPTGKTQYINRYSDHPYNYTASSHFSHQLDSTGGEFTVDLDFSDYYNKPGQAISNELYDAGGQFLMDSLNQLNQVRRLNIYSAKVDLSKTLEGGVRFEAGLKSSYVKANSNDHFYDVFGTGEVLNPNQSNHFINKENINAGYINLNKEFRKLTVQAGLRAEHTANHADQLNNGEEIRQNYVKLFPSLFLDYKFDDVNKVNFRIGRRIDRPAYSLMNPFRRPLSATLYFEGNPNLQPQTSTNLELTYSFTDAFYITGGYEIFNDFITTLPFLDSDKVTQTRIPSNVNGTHSYNVEIGYSKRLLGWWTPSYDVDIYRQSSHGSVMGVDVENPGIVSVDFDLNNSFSIAKGLTAEVNYKFAGRRRIVSTTYGGYSVLNLGVKKSVIQGKGTITLNLTNVFQSENETSTYQYGDLYQSWLAHFYSRTVNLNFSYRFGKGKSAKQRQAGSVEEQRRTGINGN